MHLAELIRDLGVILGLAALVSMVFQRIRQPVVLGYIVAGVLASSIAGPFQSDFRVLAELGVIFLMFSLGLEFSFRKVFRLGPSVGFAALFEVGGLFALGTWTGSALGWPLQDSLFLGGMVSISSTTIIVKALDEFGLKTRRFAQLVLGMLIFEDLLAVLLLVIFSGLSGSSDLVSASRVSSLASSLAASVGTMVLFVGGWFLVGTLVLPRILRRVSSSGSDEMLMILSVGLCLLMGIAAAHLGYSAGLGAFLMGSILAESSESHRIENLVRPLRDLFVAVFFVSVGMLIEPKSLWNHRSEILWISGLVITGKFSLVALGSILAGRTLKTAVLVGGSMVQIGEFSFIMAALGISMQILDPELQPVIVAVSVLTTLVTPLFIRLSPAIFGGVDRLLPSRARFFLERYAAWSERRAAEMQPDPGLRSALVRWILAGFVVTLISRVALDFASPWVGTGLAVLLLPFLWIFLRGLRIEHSDGHRVAGLGNQLIRLGSQVFALIVASTLAWPYFSSIPSLWLGVLVGVFVLVRLVSGIGGIYHWVEETFLRNLASGQNKKGGAGNLLRHLAPWEGQLVRLKVHADSEFAGQSIQEAALRNRFQLNIVAIQRGSRLFVAPSPRQQLFPKDEILVLGEEEQVERARKQIELGRMGGAELDANPIESYQLRAIEVTGDSPCAGKTLRESGIRDRHSALVVGIERAGKRIMNPDSSMKVHPGDTLWVVGQTESLGSLASELLQPPKPLD